LDSLLDEPRPGALRTISDSQVERVIAKAAAKTTFALNTGEWLRRDLRVISIL